MTSDKKCVIPVIAGGLGNQLFMYCAARRLAIKNGMDVVVNNVSGFENDKYGRQYMLDRFQIKAKLANEFDQLKPFRRIRRKLLMAVNERKPMENRTYIKQSGVGFEEGLLRLTPASSIHLEGYWQSEKYFADVAPQLRQELKLVDKLNYRDKSVLSAIKQSDCAVALHVRFFSDGTNSSANASVAYYREAMTILEGQFDNPSYFIFSDRPEEAVERLGLPAATTCVVNHNNCDALAHYDLYLMSECDHIIGANSTFSWWACWLADSRRGLRILPKMTGYTGFSNWGFEGLIPERWTQV